MSTNEQRINEMKRAESDRLINRSQMVIIARQFNILVSQSTIHSWANQSSFPLVMGQDGHKLLYSRDEFIAFIKRKVRKIQEEH